MGGSNEWYEPIILQSSPGNGRLTSFALCRWIAQKEQPISSVKVTQAPTECLLNCFSNSPWILGSCTCQVYCVFSSSILRRTSHGLTWIPRVLAMFFLLTRHLVLFSRGFYQYVQKEDSGTSTGALIVCESRHGHMSCLGLPFRFL